MCPLQGSLAAAAILLRRADLKVKASGRALPKAFLEVLQKRREIEPPSFLSRQSNVGCEKYIGIISEFNR